MTKPKGWTWDRPSGLFFTGEAKVGPLVYKAVLDDLKGCLFRARGGWR